MLAIKKNTDGIKSDTAVITATTELLRTDAAGIREDTSLLPGIKNDLSQLRTYIRSVVPTSPDDDPHQPLEQDLESLVESLNDMTLDSSVPTTPTTPNISPILPILSVLSFKRTAFDIAPKNGTLALAICGRPVQLQIHCPPSINFRDTEPSTTSISISGLKDVKLVGISPCGKRVVAQSQDFLAMAYNIASGMAYTSSDTGNKRWKKSVRKFAFSPDGRKLAVLNGTGERISIWEFKDEVIRKSQPDIVSDPGPRVLPGGLFPSSHILLADTEQFARNFSG